MLSRRPQKLLAESQEYKTKANALFAAGDYQAAIDSYQEAVSLCPHYLYYDLAVLHSNVAASHLKLGQWKEAIKSATDSIKALERADKEIATSEEKLKQTQQEQTATNNSGKDDDNDIEEEIVSAGAQGSTPAIPKVKQENEAELAIKKRREDAARIRAKALMRRARARCEAGGWSNLSGAEEDYKQLAGMSNLGLADKKLVQKQLRDLPARTKAAQEKEMGEMWGKLKDVSAVRLIRV